MASPAFPLRRRKPGRHAGNPTPVTLADVVTYLLLRPMPGNHAIVLISKGVKYSKPIPGEIGKPAPVRTEAPAPVVEVKEATAPPVVDEHGFFEEPQPAIAIA